MICLPSNLQIIIIMLVGLMKKIKLLNGDSLGLSSNGEIDLNDPKWDSNTHKLLRTLKVVLKN